MQAELDRKRKDMAEGMLRASVGAWKAFRNPPPEIAEKIANDPSGKEKQIWNMQVRAFCAAFGLWRGLAFP